MGTVVCISGIPDMSNLKEPSGYSFMAMEIFNHSPYPQEHKFLGIRHRHYQNECLTITSMTNGRIVPYDQILSLLESSVNPHTFTGYHTKVGNIVFNSSLLCEPYKDKYLTIRQGRNMGSSYNWDKAHLDEERYDLIKGQAAQKEIWTGLVLDPMTEFEIEIISPGERLVIALFTNSRELHSNPYLVKLELDQMVHLFDQHRIEKILSSF